MHTQRRGNTESHAAKSAPPTIVAVVVVLIAVPDVGAAAVVHPVQVLAERVPVAVHPVQTNPCGEYIPAVSNVLVKAVGVGLYDELRLGVTRRPFGPQTFPVVGILAVFNLDSKGVPAGVGVGLHIKAMACTAGPGVGDGALGKQLVGALLTHSASIAGVGVGVGPVKVILPVLW